MPELPEVETIRRGLAPVMVGSRIERLDQRRPDLRFPLPDNFAGRLEGRLILSLTRRAKYLIATIEGGDALVIHLGMSGRFQVDRPMRDTQNPGGFVHSHGNDPRHDHVVVHLAGGAAVTYNDPRRFGFMLLMRATDLPAHPLIRNLGVEPLGAALTPQHLASRAHGRKTDLKAFLLDQRIIAGLGNIYVAEALFRARLRPSKPAATLASRSGAPTTHAERLISEIKAVLEAAIQAGGSTLRDYRHTDGASGDFQRMFSVYGRAGEPCPRAGCGGVVKRIVQAGRSSFFCRTCQR